jgi:flagellar biogenesis protein FliO
MLQHIIAFSLYTLAMIGIFFIAFVVYKKTIESNGSKFGEGIKIENMLRLSQRKSLYIVNVQGERFLIASDPENTTFLAKLASKAITPKETEGLTLDSKRITETPLYSPNDIKTTDEDSKKQVEKYIKELQMLDNARIELENTEDDYSNAVDIKSKNHIMKNILKELENKSKRTNI